MVKGCLISLPFRCDVVTPEHPERTLALSYSGEKQAALVALLALDDALAALLRTTSEPALGQMRLAWWRESVERLDSAPAPAEPVLRALAADVLPLGVTGKSLVPIVHGWEVLVEEEHLDAMAIQRYAALRGGTLFEIAGKVLGSPKSDRVDILGRGWALADLARAVGDAEVSRIAREMAANRLSYGLRRLAPGLSRASRSLGALAHLARMDLALPPGAPPPIGSPKRVGRLLWHRLTGR